MGPHIPQNIPQSIARPLFRVVQVLQSGDGEELAHANPIFQQQLDKVAPVMLQGLHHGVLQRPMRPLLPVDEDFGARNVRPVPGQSQTELLRGGQVLGLEQGRQDDLV